MCIRDRTIIDSSEAAGEAMGDGYGAFEDAGSTYESQSETSSHVHYFDLSKWYWKLLLMLAVFVVFFAAFRLLGGIFALLVRFAGPVSYTHLGSSDQQRRDGGCGKECGDGAQILKGTGQCDHRDQRRSVKPPSDHQCQA